MLYYLLAIAAGIFLANPIENLLSSSSSSSSNPRDVPLSPRPQLNESLLVIDRPGDAAAAVKCPPDSYGARILSRDPLVVYLEGFLNEEERRHLLEIRQVESGES